MTSLAINYVVNPLSKFWALLIYVSEVRGMTRAAEELYRQGYHKESQNVYQRIREMKI
jgi:hypothetical protein